MCGVSSIWRSGQRAEGVTGPGAPRDGVHRHRHPTPAPLCYGIPFHETPMLRIVLIVAVVGLAILLVSALPDIRRYLRVRGK